MNPHSKFSIALHLVCIVFCLTRCADPEERQITIDEVSPVAGGIGAHVKIKGSAFGNDMSVVNVFFNDKQAKIVQVSDTMIIADVPPAAETGTILLNVRDQAVEWSGIFTVLNGRWTPIANLSGNSMAYTASFALGGKGYITGGIASFEGSNALNEYDPVTDEWSVKSNFPGADRYAPVAFTIGEKAYVGLGNAITGNDSLALISFYEYDPGNDTWTQKANFPGGPSNWGIGFSIKGKGYAGLGSDQIHHAGFYEYNPQTDTWTQLKTPTGFIGWASLGFVIGDTYYGGCSVGSAEWWKYEPEHDEWTKLKDVPFPPPIFEKAFAIGDKGYVAAGTTNVWEYDPTTDSWEQKTSEPDETMVREASSFSIGNKAYIGNGTDASGKRTTKFFVFDPQ